MGAYGDYWRLLRRLHKLDCKGKLDSDQAEAIRNEMDGLWRELSDEERKRVERLSAKLSRGD